MTDAGFFRGTSADQDNRFSDKEKKLLKQMKFSDSITKKVDMSKVDLKVMKPWISDRLSELLGIEDDVLNEFVFNQLEAENHPDGRKIQINLTGFLNGKNARIFAGELWDMLLDAMEHQGIPSSILEAKKQEISQRIKSEQPSLVVPEIKDSSRQLPRSSDSRGDDSKKQYGLASRSRDNSRDRSNTDRRRDYRDERRSRDERDRPDRDRGDRYNRDDRSRRDDRYRDRDPRDKQPSIRYLDSSSRPSRFNDNKDSSRDRRDRSPPPRARSRSPRHKPRDEESPKAKDEEFTVQEKKLPTHGSDEEAPRVEMKKHKKSKHRHNRKRVGSDDSGHSGSGEDNDDENGASDSGSEGHHRKSRSTKEKKKKKKSKRSRSDEPPETEGKNLEQELRVRALESMKRQRESVDED